MMSTLVHEPAAHPDPCSPENLATIPMLETLRTMAMESLTNAVMALENRDACDSSLKRIHRLQRKWGRTPIEMATRVQGRDDGPCAVRAPCRQAPVKVTLNVAPVEVTLNVARATLPTLPISPPIAPEPAQQLSFVSVWVDTVAGLDRAKADIAAAARSSGERLGVGIDCEWSDPIEHCSVLQIAAAGTAWVIDTAEQRHTDPGYGAALLAFGVWFFSVDVVARLGFGFRSDVRKIGCLLHKLTGMYDCAGAGGSDDNSGGGGDGGDIDVMGHCAVTRSRLVDANAGLQQTVDVQIKSQRVLGVRDSPSLVAVANRVLGTTLDKAEQQSDWEARPLSNAQLQYAGTDAWVLIALDAALRLA